VLVFCGATAGAVFFVMRMKDCRKDVEVGIGRAPPHAVPDGSVSSEVVFSNTPQNVKNAASFQQGMAANGPKAPAVDTNNRL